jgi:hypothetical protein
MMGSRALRVVPMAPNFDDVRHLALMDLDLDLAVLEAKRVLQGSRKHEQRRITRSFGIA